MLIITYRAYFYKSVYLRFCECIILHLVLYYQPKWIKNKIDNLPWWRVYEFQINIQLCRIQFLLVALFLLKKRNTEISCLSKFMLFLFACNLQFTLLLPDELFLKTINSENGNNFDLNYIYPILNCEEI